MNKHHKKAEQLTIVHVTTSLKIGGAETVLTHLVQHLSQFNHVVIYFHDGPNRQRLQELGVATYQVRGLFYLYDPVFFVRLFKLLRRLHPDCIHSLLWSANVASRLIAKLLGIPLVCAAHNNLDQDGGFRNIVDRLTVPLADNIIAVSNEVAQSLKSNHGSWLAAHKVTVISNGIDVEQTHERARQSTITRADVGLSENDFVIGSVGRFMPVKNYDLLIDSFLCVVRERPSAKLVLVGIGPEEEALRKKAHDVGIAQKVTFVVGQPACGYYQLFDCFALTSDKEGVSMALLEAMSFGLPCVVTNVACKHMVIQTEINGMLVPAQNIQLLTQSFMRLMDDASLRATLGQQAKNTIQRGFSVDVMTARYAALFESVVVDHKRI